MKTIIHTQLSIMVNKIIESDARYHVLTELIKTQIQIERTADLPSL